MLIATAIGFDLCSIMNMDATIGITSREDKFQALRGKFDYNISIENY